MILNKVNSGKQLKHRIYNVKNEKKQIDWKKTKLY